MTIWLKRLTALSMGAALALAALGAPAQAAQDTWAYWVKRDGTTIGEHVVGFDRDGNRTKVTILTDIAVKVAFITAFRFSHESEEVWEDGRLIALDSRTNDDGTDHAVSARAAGDALQVVADGETYEAPADTLVHDQWNLSNTRADRLLDIFNGTMLTVSYTDAGEEQIDVNGRQITARRFDATGDLERTFWFDAKDRLVKVAFDSRGSAVTYEIRSGE